MSALTRRSVRSRALQWVSMIWIFERDREIVRVETRFDSKTNEYVLAIFGGECLETIERYRRPGEFGDRLRALEQQLVAERWSQIDNPEIAYRRMNGVRPPRMADE